MKIAVCVKQVPSNSATMDILKQDPVKVETWLKEEYPAISAKAKE